MRKPKLAIAAVLLILVALAGTSAYAGYLMVGLVADYLGTGRFVAGLVLGAVFARLPYVSQGKLRTIGLLPKKARLPVVVVLLSVGLTSFLYRGDMVPALFLGLAATIVLTFRWIRLTVVPRAMSAFFRPSGEPAGAGRADPTIIDADFKEKKD